MLDTTRSSERLQPSEPVKDSNTEKQPDMELLVEQLVVSARKVLEFCV